MKYLHGQTLIIKKRIKRRIKKKKEAVERCNHCGGAFKISEKLKNCLMCGKETIDRTDNKRKKYCSKECRSKDFYLKNKEKIITQTKQYKLNYIEHISKRCKKYYLKNKVKIKKYNKEYKLKNLVKVKEYFKLHYLKN